MVPFIWYCNFDSRLLRFWFQKNFKQLIARQSLQFTLLFLFWPRESLEASSSLLFWAKFNWKLALNENFTSPGKFYSTDHIMRIVCKRVIIHDFSSIFSSISILWVYRKRKVLQVIRIKNLKLVFSPFSGHRRATDWPKRELHPVTSASSNRI